MPETIEQVVRRVSTEEGIDPDLLWAVVQQESGGNPDSIGDQGHSVGLFQENDRGRGAGMSIAQRSDVEASTRRAAAEFKTFIARNPTLPPGELAAAAQRPNDRAGYAASVNRIFAGLKGATQGAPGPVRAAVQSASEIAGGVAQTGERAAGLLWPVVGGRPGQITTPFGGTQSYSAGMTTAIGSVNNGVDIQGQYGAPVVAVTDGTVVSVQSGYGDRGKRVATDGSGWGNSIVIRHDDGTERRYSHLATNSATVQPGQRIGGGTLIGAVGDSGNATGPHLDFETKVNGRYVDGTQGAFQPTSSATPPTTSNYAGEGPFGPARPATTAAGSTAMPDAPATPSTVSRLQKNVDDLEQKIAALQERQAGMDPDEASILDKQLAPLLAARTAALSQLGAEENRIRDDAKAKATPPAPPTTKAGPAGTTWQWNPETKKWEDSGIPVDPAAQAAAGTTQQAAELALRRAQQQYDAENDPVKKETARVALEQAKQSLETSRQAAVRADRPGTVTGPDGTVYQLNKDTQLPDLSTGVKLPDKPTTTMVNGRQVTTANGEITSTTDLMTEFERNADRIKSEGAAEAQRLSNLNAQGLISQRERDDQWKDWYNRNVEVPMKQAQEERARAAEARAAEADRRAAAQAAQEAEMKRQQFGYTAGRDAVADELKMLPNRVGADFFAQKTANEALIAQGKPGQYSASAFTTPTPDLQSIAQQATAKALAGISPYAATLAGVPQAAAPDYSKINLQQLLATAPAYGAPGAAVPGMPGATAPPVPLR